MNFNKVFNITNVYEDYLVAINKLQEPSFMLSDFRIIDAQKKDLELRLDSSLKNEISTHLENVRRLFDNLKAKGITFWDINFFILMKQNEKIEYWSDFERRIHDFLVKNKKQHSMSMRSIFDDFDIELITPDIRTDYEEIVENIFFKMSDEIKNKIALIEFAKSTVNSQNGFDYKDFLFEELKKLEMYYGEYLSRNVINRINSTYYSQKIYRDNLLKLIENDMDNDYYLINFNYTLFSSSSRDMKKSKLEIKRNNEVVSISEVNVHGRYDKLCIFGIDQTKIDSSASEYIFTKTYRKLEAYDQLVSYSLPFKQQVKEVFFYGHSLSEADYSYFQSIFDYYNVYEGEITLNFLYSYYGEVPTHKSIKSKKIEDIIKLLQNYGQTMNNKDHGKNLIHKLLIENRLNIKDVNIKEVKLKKIS